MAGHFITFEGGEGSGKSTQIRLLADELVKAGKAVVTTREPGGTPGAEEIRKLLVTGSADKWDKTTETLLFFAARRAHMPKILSAVESGQIVLCDRFADSTMAYQGYGYGDDPVQQRLINTLYKETVGDFKPDMTVLLDVPVEVGLYRSRRAENTELRFENKELEFHERLRQAYLKLAKAEPNRFLLIDATQTQSAIHNQIMKAFQERGLFKTKAPLKTCSIIKKTR